MLGSLFSRVRLVAAAGIMATLLATLSGGAINAAPAHALTAMSAQTWSVATGAQSPDETIQGMVFLPGSITIDAGDTIVWHANSAEPHTVTFNAAPGEQFNPFAPAIGNGSDFDGSQYVTSAALANVSSATAGFPTEQSFSLTFTKAGAYHYICLVHPGMGGSVIVQPAGTPYPETQAQYNVQSQAQAAHIIAAGWQMRAQDISSSDNQHVFVGDTNMEAGADVMAYMRSTVVVHVGQSVQFVNKSMGPHTVTFGAEIGNPQNPWCALGCSASTLPATGPIFFGSYAATLNSSNALFNSGWIFTGVSVTVTFNQIGVYTYHCALHDYMGMTGRVIVVP